MTASGRAIGGHARATKLSPERRREIAKHAAQVRWGTILDALDKSLKTAPSPAYTISDPMLEAVRRLNLASRPQARCAARHPNIRPLP